MQCFFSVFYLTVCYVSLAHCFIYVLFVCLFVTLVCSSLFSLCLIVCYVSDFCSFSLCSVWLFFTLEPRVLFRMCSVLVCCLSLNALFRMCSVWFFVAFVSFTVVCVLFHCLSRWCLAHCFVCSVWLFVTLVSRALFVCSVWLFVTLVSRALFCVFCLIVCHVSVSRTVFSVFCLIV